MLSFIACEITTKQFRQKFMAVLVFFWVHIGRMTFLFYSWKNKQLHTQLDVHVKLLSEFLLSIQ
jgi:hypothetical protein